MVDTYGYQYTIETYKNGKKILDPNSDDFQYLYKHVGYGEGLLKGILRENSIITGFRVGQIENMDWKAVDNGGKSSGVFTLGGNSYPFETNGAPGDIVNAPGFNNTQSVFMDWGSNQTFVTYGNKRINIVDDSSDGDDTQYIKQLLSNYHFKYKSGGLADFTGPAWLDGTKSRPEYVLNAEQTQRFFSLIDVLEGFDKNNNSNTHSGDNYIDVDINVEKIDSDYDVDQLAKRVRTLIYDDATYRNVNAVSHMR